MSDSDLSDAPSAPSPPDSELSQALRNQVRDSLKAGNHEGITVSSMRRAAEEALGLDAGFYKNSQKWKEESKRIVHEAFEEFEASQHSPAKSTPKAQAPKPAKRVALSKKRGSPGEDAKNGPAKKRRKFESAKSSEEALSSPPSDLSEDKEPKAATKAKPKTATQKAVKPRKSSKIEKHGGSDEDASKSNPDGVDDKPAEANDAASSDSDLSVLTDEAPKPKRKRKGSSAPAEKRGRKPKSKPDPPESDPDAAEIKRLQSWLVKCGIRKLWGKELKQYETPKAKIKHLKDMLSDAGMTGRYSLERANQIKEERELRADIEAVKEGAVRWGKNEEDVESVDDQDESGKPKRRLMRGAQILDFLDSDDGEETD